MRAGEWTRLCPVVWHPTVVRVRTATPEDFTRLLGDVSVRCFCYPDSTVVHPGHGDDTTLGAERPALDTWRDRGW